MIQIILTEARLYLRDHMTLFFVFALPLGMLLIFGLPEEVRKPLPELGGQTPLDSLLPSGMTAIAFAIVAAFALPGALSAYRQQGVLRRLRTTPVGPARLLLAQLVVNLVAALASLVLMIAVGAAVLGIPLPRHLPGLLAACVLGLAALFAIGLLISAVASGPTSAGMLGALVVFPSMFFAGIWLQKHDMPDLLRRASDFTPLSAFRESLQDAWTGTAPDPLHLLTLAVTAALCGFAAARLFRWE
ncbi:ABC transporter permease [Actinomadura craniellae]|uniref:Transport permease protein n=1 Tax=Actinomadura craniellae TaxID=2231787 RepID=A0A365H5T8_9ACTN|nr:ABC transporter permease [Actinomadura craniellae]RAY14366.1 ABC transporter permease [Actinomadura craniellae]